MNEQRLPRDRVVFSCEVNVTSLCNGTLFKKLFKNLSKSEARPKPTLTCLHVIPFFSRAWRPALNCTLIRGLIGSFNFLSRFWLASEIALVLALGTKMKTALFCVIMLDKVAFSPFNSTVNYEDKVWPGVLKISNGAICFISILRLVWNLTILKIWSWLLQGQRGWLLQRMVKFNTELSQTLSGVFFPRNINWSL